MVTRSAACSWLRYVTGLLRWQQSYEKYPFSDGMIHTLSCLVDTARSCHEQSKPNSTTLHTRVQLCAGRGTAFAPVSQSFSAANVS